MKRATFIILLTLVAVSCRVGPRPSTFPPAQQPAGVETTLRLNRGAKLQGELLAVEPAALIMLSEGHVTRVAYASIDNASFGPSEIRIRVSVAGMTQESQDQLRRFSRFPQGLSPSLLRALLAGYGQTEIAVAPSP